jgi:hypothetical protein
VNEFFICFFQSEFESAQKALERVTIEIEAMSQKDSGANETRAKEHPGSNTISLKIDLEVLIEIL